MPRPSRYRSDDHYLHGGSYGVIVIALLILSLIGFWIYNYQFATEKTVTITVSRLDDQSTGSNGHQYMVFTKAAGGQPGEVFKDTDSFWHGKWNSSDLFSQLQVGKTYSCKVYGRRNHFMSNYRDLLSCQQVS